MNKVQVSRDCFEYDGRFRAEPGPQRVMREPLDGRAWLGARLYVQSLAELTPDENAARKAGRLEVTRHDSAGRPIVYGEPFEVLDRAGPRVWYVYAFGEQMSENGEVRERWLRQDGAHATLADAEARITTLAGEG